MVNHHHWTEESFIFPEIEKFSGKPGSMDDPRHQHEKFHGGLERLLAYTESTKPKDYHLHGPGGIKNTVDSFSKDLIDHLYAEIDVCLSMKDLDSAGLKKTWDQGEAIAKQNGNLGMLVSCLIAWPEDEDDDEILYADNMKYNVFPCILGSADKTYEGGNDFPPLPWILPYVVNYWFAAGNGGWRFNPCDFWGQPRPLAFGPGEQK